MFRVTPQSSINTAIRQAQARQTEIANLQHQLSTGLKISKPSDAPDEWSSLVRKKAAVNRMEVQLENISTVRQRLNESVSSLQEAGNLLVRAREIALNGAQSQHRETLALEVDRLIDGMLQISNTSSVDLQLYGGTASHQQAFEITGQDVQGRPTQVTYQGSLANSQTVVSQLSTANGLAPGALAFQRQSRETTQYLGSTGAAAGQGTDSASGTGALLVRHTETLYDSGFVLPGNSSIEGDTIIGPAGAHTLTIADDPELGRTVSLNGGGAIPFDANSTDLKVESPGGSVVYVDVSSVPASFAGEISIEARGTVSVDGGVTEDAISFSESQIVTHSETGKVTVVDSQNIRLAGTDRIEYTGTTGVFESLIQLRDDLRQAEDWSSNELVAIMDARLADVERAHSQVMEFVGEQSVELANLDRLENKTRELRLVTQEAVIETESADAAQVIVDLQTQQNHLQFIFASTAAMNQISLLDFIS